MVCTRKYSEVELDGKIKNRFFIYFFHKYNCRGHQWILPVRILAYDWKVQRVASYWNTLTLWLKVRQELGCHVLADTSRGPPSIRTSSFTWCQETQAKRRHRYWGWSLLATQRHLLSWWTVSEKPTHPTLSFSTTSLPFRSVIFKVRRCFKIHKTPLHKHILTPV